MVALKNNQPRSLTCNMTGGSGIVHLAPGVNLNVPQADVDAAKKHPVFKRWLELGMVDIMQSPPKKEGEITGISVTEDRETGQPMPISESSSLGPNPKNGGNPFAEMTIAEATPIIEGEMDADKLQVWLNFDDRAGIKERIQKQIRELTE